MKKALIALAILAVCGAVLSPLALQLVKGIRSGQNLEGAILAKQAGDNSKALSLLQSAHNLDPESGEILRLLGSYGADVHHPNAINWWIDAAEAGLLDTGELIALMEYGYETGAPDRVEGYLNRLLRTDGGNPRVQALHVRSLQRARRDYETFTVARQYVRDGNADPVVLSAYITLSFAIPQSTRADREEAIQILLRTAENDGELGILSIRSLLRHWKHLDADGKSRIAGRLAAHPQAQFSDRLALLGLKRADGTPRDELKAAAQAYFGALEVDSSAPEAAQSLRVEYARWLNREGLHAEVLELLDEEAAKGNAGLFLARQVALIQTGRADQALQENLGQNPLTQGIKLVMRALELMQMGRADKVEENLTLAIEVVELEEVGWLEEILRTSGRYDLLIPMFEKLEARMDNPLPAQIKLIEYYYLTGASQGLTRLARSVNPADLDGFPVQKISLLYLRLLFRENPAETRRMIEQMVTDYPSIVDFRVLLAFSYALAGQAEAAAGLMEGSVDEFLSDSRQMRICAACCAHAGGLKDKAAQYLQGIDPETLLPQERILTRNIRQDP